MSIIRGLSYDTFLINEESLDSDFILAVVSKTRDLLNLKVKDAIFSKLILIINADELRSSNNLNRNHLIIS